ncbi:MAG: hypothetical protein IKV40_01825, partial [Clostridia bacterium]|nr:hypothetical protein [Clostridia bacterium]
IFKYYLPVSRAEAAAMIHRLIENSVPIDTDEYTYVVFIGNSINGTGNIPIHFKAIADDEKLKVYSYDHCEIGVAEDHYEWFSTNMHPDTKIAELSDIFIFQEAGGGFVSVGENKELKDLIGDRSHLPGGFGNGFCSGYNDAGKMMDLLGHDKEYYTFSASDNIGVFDEKGTDTLLGIKKIYAEEYNLPLVFVSELSTFNPDLNLSLHDTYPDGLHPTRLMGYAAALALYCDIYDVSPTEQNNGDLKPEEIPGETGAEKDAFMAELKKTVDDILKVQDISK